MEKGKKEMVSSESENRVEPTKGAKVGSEAPPVQPRQSGADLNKSLQDAKNSLVSIRHVVQEFCDVMSEPDERGKLTWVSFMFGQCASLAESAERHLDKGSKDILLEIQKLDRISGLELQIKAMQTTHKSVVEINRQLTNRIKELEDDNSALHTEKSTLDNSASELRSMLDSSQKQVSEMNEKLGGWEKRALDAESNVVQLQLREQYLKHEMDLSDRKTKRQNAAMEEERVGLINLLAQRQDQLNQEKDRVGRCIGENTNLKIQLDEAQEKITQLTEEQSGLIGLYGENKKLKAQLLDANEKIAKITEDLADSSRVIQSSVQDHSMYTADREMWDKEREGIQRQSHELLDRCHTLESQLADMTKQRDILLNKEMQEPKEEINEHWARMVLSSACKPIGDKESNGKAMQSASSLAMSKKRRFKNGLLSFLVMMLFFAYLSGIGVSAHHVGAAGLSLLAYLFFANKV